MERAVPTTVREAVDQVIAHGNYYRYWPNVWSAPDEDEWPEQDESLNHFRLVDADKAEWIDLTWFAGPDAASTANRDALDATAEEAIEQERWDPERPHVLEPEDTTRLIWLDSPDPELIQMIKSLADYPLLDEEAWSTHQLEAQDEAWANWASHEFQRGVEAQLEAVAEPMGLDVVDLDAVDDDLLELFRQMADEANVYWHEESDGTQVIDMNRVLEALFPLRPSVLRMLTPDERYHVLLGTIADWLERRLNVELDFSRDDTVDPVQELAQLLRDWNPAGPGGWDLRSPFPDTDGFVNYHPDRSTPDMRFAPGSIGQFVPVAALAPYVMTAPAPPEMRAFPVEEGGYPELRERLERAAVTRVVPRPETTLRSLEQAFPFAGAEDLPVRDIQRGVGARQKWDGNPPPEASALPEEIAGVVRRFTESLSRPAWRTQEGAHNACFAASRVFVAFAKKHGFDARLMQIVWPYLDEEDALDPDDPDTFGPQHYVAVVDGWPIDWTATQFCLPELGEDLGFPYVPERLEDWVDWLDRVYHRSKYGEPQMFEEEIDESVPGTTGSGAQLSVPLPLTYQAAADALGNRFRVTIGLNTELLRPAQDDWWLGEDEIQVLLHGEAVIVLLPSGGAAIRVTQPTRLTMDRLKRITGLPVYRRKGVDYVESGGERLVLPLGEWVQVELPLPPRPARTMEEALMPHTPPEDPEWPAPVDLKGASDLLKRLPMRQRAMALFTAARMAYGDENVEMQRQIDDMEQAFLALPDSAAWDRLGELQREAGLGDPLFMQLVLHARGQGIGTALVAIRSAAARGVERVHQRDPRVSPRAARGVWLREWWDRVRSRLAFREGGASDVTGRR